MEFLKLELQVVVGCLGWVLELNWGPLQELQLSRLCGPSSGPQHCTAYSSLAARRASGPLPSLPLISPLGRWDYSRRLRCSVFCVGSGAQPQLTRPAQRAYLPTEPWDISPALFPRKSFTTELGRNPQLGRYVAGFLWDE